MIGLQIIIDEFFIFMSKTRFTNPFILYSLFFIVKLINYIELGGNIPINGKI